MVLIDALFYNIYCNYRYYITKYYNPDYLVQLLHFRIAKNNKTQSKITNIKKKKYQYFMPKIKIAKE